MTELIELAQITEHAQPIRPAAPLTVCDGQGMKRLARAGLAWLEQHYQAVNNLNVFPVPDGDTGTNMLLTMRAAYAEAAHVESSDVGLVAARLAHGALHGSRGNSGTVLSQFLVGFASAIRDVRVFDARRLAVGLREAVRLGYQTFTKPVEGTILTVAQEIAHEVEAAVAHGVSDLFLILKRAVARGKQAVARTPHLLPILKKAGVVDSGGQGLVVILEGMLHYLSGQPLPHSAGGSANGKSDAALISAAALSEVFTLSDEYGANGFGYDVQYILEGTDLDVDAIREAIRAMGSSAIVVGDPSLVKVHVHVSDPSVPVEYGKRLGRLSSVVIEDMQAQSEQYRMLRTALEPGQVGVIAVALGAGLAEILRHEGAAHVISGGQTMNPSTGEFLAAIRALNTDKIVLLPNNSNVILTAEQAARLAAADGYTVRVIPTRTIPQGITALLGYTRDGALDEMAAAMQQQAAQVVTGEITQATRGLELDGLSVQAGQWIGLVDDQLSVAADALDDVALRLLERMSAQNHSLALVYYGDTVSREEAESLAARLQARYPDLEFQVHFGGQPHYPYIISIE